MRTSYSILLLSIAMVTGTVSYALWRHVPRDGMIDVAQQEADDAPTEDKSVEETRTETGSAIEGTDEVGAEDTSGIEETDFIRYTSSSFGLSQGFVVHADGSFRIEDAIAEHQQRGPGCAEGTISQEDFRSIAAAVLSSGFFSTRNDIESDFFMCDSGYALEASIGMEQHTLGSVCMQRPTEEVLHNEQIVNGIVAKVRSILETSTSKECASASSASE